MSDYESGPMSGFRDFPPEAASVREKVITPMEEVYMKYGYGPLVTPAFERPETILGQEGEINKQVYRVLNNDGDVIGAARFDHTVPLARFMAANSNKMDLPFRRFANGPVWRGERPGAGRYREFVQLDADVVGEEGVTADIEVLSMMIDAMDTTGTDYFMRVNDRRFLDAMGNVGEIAKEERDEFFRIIDKTDKVGQDLVLEEVESQFGSKARSVLEQVYSIQNTELDNEEKLEKLREVVSGDQTGEIAITNLQGIVEGLKASGKNDKVKLDPTIARGLGYYTGMVFETNLTEYPDLGSVCSGGRYDKLIEALGGPDLPAVGASIGVDRLIAGLEEIGVIDRKVSIAQTLVTYIGKKIEGYYGALKVADELRKNGVATVVDTNDPGYKKRMRNALRSANNQGIPYVVFVSPEKPDQIEVKNMHTGEQNFYTTEEAIKLFNQNS